MRTRNAALFVFIEILIGTASLLCTVSSHAVGRTTKARPAIHTKAKPKGKRRVRVVGPRLYSGVPLKILTKHTETISNGVTYTEEVVSRNRWRVGIIHADLTVDSLRVELRKAKDSAFGLERVEEIARRIDSTSDENVIAAVNANYWRAGSDELLGGAEHDGEIIGYDNYKHWSRLEIFNDGSFAIAPESLSVIVIPTTIPPFSVTRVNLRLSDSTIILYNHYFGASVPPAEPGPRTIHTADPLLNLAHSIQHGSQTPDSGTIHTTNDSLEIFYETDEDITPIPDSLVQKPRSEQFTLKCAFVYLDTPSVNFSLHCRVVGFGERTFGIPRNGGVLSFPRFDSVEFHKLRIGDTITLECVTTPTTALPVKEMLMAGPRLVRNGMVSVETDAENFHKKSFIAGSHARTAIGISKDQKNIILVTVDRPNGNRKSGRPGIGLSDLARILVREGAYDAMNFDGGSSTSLVVNAHTVFPDTGVEFSRHVASALCIIRPKNKTKTR